MKKICALLFFKLSHCFVHLDQQGQGNKVIIFASSPSLSSPFSPSPSPSFYRRLRFRHRLCLCLCHRLISVFACAIALLSSSRLPHRRLCLHLIAVCALSPSPHRRLRLIAVFALSPSPHRRLRLHLRHRFVAAFACAVISSLSSTSPSSHLRPHRCLYLRLWPKTMEQSYPGKNSWRLNDLAEVIPWYSFVLYFLMSCCIVNPLAATPFAPHFFCSL
ncbi:uncharacterized protein LOC116924397 isoform X1 [Daphnia magna]|uniref:uncharacterized protein LOC116924397 isoform X1 n=1 Tax=Daphnia magna TaxID=35525 RepID=UPI001E1BB555|nr:uncharacterized protein LOC116924397 isoform X1 [Daphnia magna]